MAAFDPLFNDFEDVAHPFFSDMWLDNAIGFQLDVLGIHLNYPRRGYSDDTYRTLLKLKAFIDASGGAAETIIAAVQSLYGATTIHYIPRPPAEIEISCDGIIPSELSDNILYDIVVSGVNIVLGIPLITMDTGENIMTMDGDIFHVLI